MVTVIINGEVCVMEELVYNRMVVIMGIITKQEEGI